MNTSYMITEIKPGWYRLDSLIHNRCTLFGSSKGDMLLRYSEWIEKKQQKAA